MKRLTLLLPLVLVSLTLLGIFSLTPKATAFEAFPRGSDGICNGQSASSAACNSSNSDPVSGKDKSGVLIQAANLISYITGMASVIAILIGGFEYVISAGDSAKVNTAKNVILYAVIGLIVVIMAQVIIRFVIGNIK